MFRRTLTVIVPTLLLASQIFIGSASAYGLDEASRTVPLNAQGDTTVLSITQLKAGKALFNSQCAQCHAGGATKTDSKAKLSVTYLSSATPMRYSVEGLVDYLKNPTTHDGEMEISDVHPSIKSADIYPGMRNLTDENLTALAGYILAQQKEWHFLDGR